jgi:hypothetical protein
VCSCAVCRVQLRVPSQEPSGLLIVRVNSMEMAGGSAATVLAHISCQGSCAAAVAAGMNEREALYWAMGPAELDPLARKVRLREIHPDISELFTQFSNIFFNGDLAPVSVEWSKRMTLCAGQCQFSRTHCVVKLSEPLLSLRPEADLIDTLLHEQIHAWLWTRKIFEREENGHGPAFKAKMREINERVGTNITVYHSFHEEVDSHRKHWWQCDGPCSKEAPYFGLVKRAMNRAPGPSDPWWQQHQQRCGGVYRKIREPPKTSRAPKRARAEAPRARTITDWLATVAPASESTDKDLSTKEAPLWWLGLDDDEMVVIDGEPEGLEPPPPKRPAPKGDTVPRVAVTAPSFASDRTDDSEECSRGGVDEDVVLLLSDEVIEIDSGSEDLPLPPPPKQQQPALSLPRQERKRLAGLAALKRLQSAS